MDSLNQKKISPYVLVSFVGVLFVAISFFLYSARFSKFATINFDDWTLYGDRANFMPTYKEYKVVVFSSSPKKDYDKIFSFLDTNKPILAIDISQANRGTFKNILYVSSSINTLLQIIQRFNIYELPSTFDLIKYKGNIYKQNSNIKILDLRREND